jgi:hypothetical protein
VFVGVECLITCNWNVSLLEWHIVAGRMVRFSVLLNNICYIIHLTVL